MENSENSKESEAAAPADPRSGATNPWRGAGPDLRKKGQEIREAVEVLKSAKSNSVDVL